MSSRKTMISLAGLKNSPIPTQHRHKIFRRMVANKDKPALGLTSWAVRLEADHQFKRYWNTDMHGASVAGMSPFEREIVISWANQNGAAKISRLKSFDEFMHPGFRSEVMNLPDDLSDITYMENEIVVIGSADFIRRLIGFTNRIPPRRYACYVRGLPAREIRKELRQTNFRIVENISDPTGHIVSCDDRERLFPLWIRG